MSLIFQRKTEQMCSYFVTLIRILKWVLILEYLPLRYRHVTCIYISKNEIVCLLAWDYDYSTITYIKTSESH